MSKALSQTRRLLIISAIVDAGLGGIKVIIGLLAGSYALVIDGIHSLSDLLTDLMVWVFHNVGSSDPDDDHPYGHAKFETIGTLLLGTLLIGLALFLVTDVFFRLISDEVNQIPSWPALVAALVSILGKEWLYQITLRLGLKTKSNLLQANAWHHRTDALSSVVVLLGIGAAMLGFPWFEMIAAIIVALMISMIGFDLGRKSIAELVDTSLSQQEIDQIREHVIGIDGVHGVHSIRTRRMGASILVDIHLQVSPMISVSEGHQVGEWVEKSLLEKLPEIKDLIVHVDPEDDEFLDQLDMTQLAPLRSEVKTLILARWEAHLELANLQAINLHYLGNKIEVELVLNTSHKKISKDKLSALSEDISWLKGIRILTENP